jgi:hypothetical protein
MELGLIDLTTVVVNLETFAPIVISLVAVYISLIQNQRANEERIEQRSRFITDLINQEDRDLKEWMNNEIKELIDRQAVILKDLATINTLLSRTVISLNTLTVKFSEHIAKFGHDSSLSFFQELNIWKSRIETLLLDLKTQVNKQTYKREND